MHLKSLYLLLSFFSNYVCLRTLLNQDSIEIYKNGANPRCCIFINYTNFHISLIFFPQPHLVFLSGRWFYFFLFFYGAPLQTVISNAEPVTLIGNILFCPNCSDGHCSSALMHVTYQRKKKKISEVFSMQLRFKFNTYLQNVFKLDKILAQYFNITILRFSRKP